jgi:hypothetical protein
MPNTACSRQVGFCAIYGHFSGFKFFLLSNGIHARPLAANASRWASGHVKIQKKNRLAGGRPCSAFRFWVSQFFKSCFVRPRESFFGYPGLPAKWAKFFT